MVMLAFGLGAALPLLLLGMLSRETLLRWRSRLADAGKGGKIVLGLLLIAVGLAVIGGFDKRIETAALDALPAWFTEISTRY
jgi:sulfite exporter TauE/SafE